MHTKRNVEAAAAVDRTALLADSAVLPAADHAAVATCLNDRANEPTGGRRGGGAGSPLIEMTFRQKAKHHKCYFYLKIILIF